MKFLIIVNLFALYYPLPYTGTAAGKSNVEGHDWLNFFLPKIRKASPIKHNFMSGKGALVSNRLEYHIGRPVLTDPLDIFCEVIHTNVKIYFMGTGLRSMMISWF